MKKESGIMDQMIKVTKAGKQQLEDELKHLKENRRKEVVEQIKTARGFGDLSENSEYDEAKNEQAKVEARIAELEHILKIAVVEDDVDEHDTTGKARMGCTIQVLNLDKNTELTYHLVGSNEVDYTTGKISDQSPIGKALLGAKAGEEVEVVNADGKKLTTLRVLDVKVTE